MSEQQQTAPAHTPAGNLNNAQLSAKVRSTDKILEQVQLNSANNASQLDQLTVNMEQFPSQLEAIMEEALSSTVTRDDLDLLHGKIDSVISQLDAVTSSAPTLRKAYDKASVDSLLSPAHRKEGSRLLAWGGTHTQRSRGTCL